MKRGVTPSQTVGPFFSIGLEWLNRTDLTGGAAGERVTVRGRLLDADGNGVPDGVLEIWQANQNGEYPGTLVNATAGFCGFGRVPTNDEGRFEFTTLKPGATRLADGSVEAPHLKISIFLRGVLQRLVTRMYFPGEAPNENDPALLRVPEQRRQTLIAQPTSDGSGKLMWDIRLQGNNETVFFEL